MYPTLALVLWTLTDILCPYGANLTSGFILILQSSSTQELNGPLHRIVLWLVVWRKQVSRPDLLQAKFVSHPLLFVSNEFESFALLENGT